MNACNQALPITTANANNAFQYFSDNWPASLSWPRDIPRPDATRPPPRYRVRSRHGRAGADRVRVVETDDPAEAAAAAHGGGAASVDVERDGVVVSVALGPDAAATLAALEAA